MSWRSRWRRILDGAGGRRRRLQLLRAKRVTAAHYYYCCCDCCSATVSGLARGVGWGMPAAARGGGRRVCLCSFRFVLVCVRMRIA